VVESALARQGEVRETGSTRRNQAMKQIAIKVAGAEREPIDRLIKPGTTALELLRDTQLEGYNLSNGERLMALSENLYVAVSDGELLFATSQARVGERGR
jgi:hypothetical protein